MANKLSSYFLFIPLFLLLLLIIFDQQLGLVYSLMMFVSYLWYIRDNNRTYKFIGDKSWGTIIFQTAIAYAAFLLISIGITKVLSPMTFSTISGNLQGVLQLMSTNTPILKDSAVLTFIGWGILIPLIETTLFFGLLLEGFAELWNGASSNKATLTRVNSILLGIILVIASLFTAFHFSSKGLLLVPLLITFAFAVVSCILVVYQRELRGGLVLHAASNSLVVITALSVI